MIDVCRSDGHIDIRKTSWLFFGPPKIGKTTLASGFPRVIFLVTSAKEVQSIKAEYIVIDTWEKTLQALAFLKKQKKKKYDYIAVDVIDIVWTNCVKEVCRRLDIKHPSEAGYGKGVDMIDLEFKKWVIDLTSTDYGLIFISHMQTREIISSGRTITKIVSTLPDRARKIVIPLVSNIGYINIELVKVKNPRTGKTKFVEKRCITFEPSSYLEAGHRDNVLPSTIVLPDDPCKAYELFKSYYQHRRGGGKVMHEP